MIKSSEVGTITSLTSALFGFAAGFAFVLLFKSGVGNKVRAISGACSTVGKMESKDNVTLAVVVRSDLPMKTGKQIAQACHAGLACYSSILNNNPQLVRKWEESGRCTVIAKLEDGGERGLTDLYSQAQKLGVCATVIQDAGRTQIPSGTVTAIGLGPADSSLINALCGSLPLL